MLHQTWNSRRAQIDHDEDDAMELDDQRILKDVANLRASSWQAIDEPAFEYVSSHEVVCSLLRHNASRTNG